METIISVTSTGKDEVYRKIIPQIKSLVLSETNLIANIANTTAVLKLAFPKVSWAGFYLLQDNELVLGPFQGKPACVRIALGKGVCGVSAQTQSTMIVPNVHEFPGHIVCDVDSKSEIVVPIIKNRQVLGVLDLDSVSFNSFDEVDKQYLEELSSWLSENVF